MLWYGWRYVAQNVSSIIIYRQVFRVCVCMPGAFVATVAVDGYHGDDCDKIKT